MDRLRRLCFYLAALDRVTGALDGGFSIRCFCDLSGYRARYCSGWRWFYFFYHAATALFGLYAGDGSGRLEGAGFGEYELCMGGGNAHDGDGIGSQWTEVGP